MAWPIPPVALVSRTVYPLTCIVCAHLSCCCTTPLTRLLLLDGSADRESCTIEAYRTSGRRRVALVIRADRRWLAC
jgi:hypothetical protein